MIFLIKIPVCSQQNSWPHRCLVSLYIFPEVPTLCVLFSMTYLSLSLYNALWMTFSCFTGNLSPSALFYCTKSCSDISTDEVGRRQSCICVLVRCIQTGKNLLITQIFLFMRPVNTELCFCLWLLKKVAQYWHRDKFYCYYSITIKSEFFQVCANLQVQIY